MFVSCSSPTETHFRTIIVNMPPSLSVVVIGRNEGLKLARCLESVLAMDYPADGTELLYVDSASSDDSVEIARRYRARLIRLHGEYLCPAAARDEGWRQSSGDYVLFCDGDCAMEPDFVRQALPHFEDPLTGCVFGTVRERQPEGCFYRRMNQEFWINVRQYGPGPLIGGTHLWRRDLLEKLDGFNRKLLTMENADLGQRLSGDGFQTWHVPYPMSVHDLGSMTFADFARRAFRNGYGHLLYLCTAGGSWRAICSNPEVRTPLTDALFLLVAATGGLLLVIQRSGWAAPWIGVSLALSVAVPMWRARTKKRGLLLRLAYGLHEAVRIPAFAYGQLAFLVDKPRRRTRYPVDWRRPGKPGARHRCG